MLPQQGHPTLAEGIPGQGLARVCQEFSRRLPKAGPSQDSNKGGDRRYGLETTRPAATSHLCKPLVTFQMPKTLLFRAGSVAGDV